MWDKNLGCLAAAYRATRHPSTGYTPNMVMLGRENRMPVDLLYGVPKGVPQPVYGDYVQELKTTLEKIHQHVRVNLNRAAERQDSYYDVRLSRTPYEKGSVILLRNETRIVGQCTKLLYPYLGPYVVTEKLSDLNYRIQMNTKGDNKVVHYDKLKLYGATPPKWIKDLLDEA